MAVLTLSLGVAVYPTSGCAATRIIISSQVITQAFFYQKKSYLYLKYVLYQIL